MVIWHVSFQSKYFLSFILILNQQKFTKHCNKLHDLTPQSMANEDVQKWQITSPKHLTVKLQRQQQSDFWWNTGDVWRWKVRGDVILYLHCNIKTNVYPADLISFFKHALPPMLTSTDGDNKFPPETAVTRYFPMTTAKQAFPAKYITLSYLHSFWEFVITQPPEYMRTHTSSDIMEL